MYGEKSGCDPARINAVCAVLLVLATVLNLGISPAFAEPVAPSANGDYLRRHYDFGQPSTSAPRVPQWIAVPRAAGRLTSKDIGLVINTADPYSVAVGEFYIQARHLTRAQVLRVQLPVKAALTPDEFRSFSAAVASFFDAPVQALALAWNMPYAVNCNSITGALALGYDASLCEHTCSPSRRSPYFNNPTTRPYSDLKMHPSMMLSARDVATAKENTMDKCAHPACQCMVDKKAPHGKYCSEHCREAGDVTELRCGCRHPECQ